MAVNPIYRPKLQDSDFQLAVGLNLVPGFTRASNLGNNPDVDTGTLPEDAWPAGGLYPWLAVATALEVVSSSASDTSAGVGARTIMINGLNSDYIITNQVITLNGVTPVTIPISLLRINYVSALTAGTSVTNVGDITIRDVVGATTRALVPIGAGVSRQAPYTVPAGYTLMLTQLLIDVESPAGSVNKYAKMTTYIKPFNGAAIYSLSLGSTNGAPYRLDLFPPVALSEKTDFALRIVNVSDNNTNVTCAWQGILKRN